MTDREQPEALRLADWLETDIPPNDTTTCADVAAELRRLYKANQALWTRLSQPEPEPVLEKRMVDELRHLVDAQGRDGCWNDGQYMLGLFNGLEFALSIFERREPKFRSKEHLLQRDYRAVATNEEGRIKWIVDDWPMNCTLYMKRPEPIKRVVDKSPPDCVVDAYEYVRQAGELKEKNGWT